MRSHRETSVLSLAPYWCASPLRDPAGGQVDLEAVGLESGLMDRVRRWSDWFEATAALFVLSGGRRLFWSDAEHGAFEREGVQIWQRAKVALAGRHVLTYVPTMGWPDRRVLADPASADSRDLVRTIMTVLVSGYETDYNRADRALRSPDIRGIATQIASPDSGESPGRVLNAVIRAQLRPTAATATYLLALRDHGFPVPAVQRR